MTFQEQLQEKLLAIVGEDKKEAMLEAVAPVFEAMGKTFKQYDDDIKALKKAAKTAPGDGGIDPRDFEELERNHEKATKDLETALRQLDAEKKAKAKVEATAADLTKKLSVESSALSSTVMANELRKAMGDFDFIAGTSDEAFDILAKGVKIAVDENGVRKVYATKKDASGAEVEISLQDHVKERVGTSELFKRILAAPLTTGGGALGGGKGGALKKPFKDMTLGERTGLFRTNPELYRQLESAERSQQ